ncbi:S41 family peptidase [Undibacterium sp. RTI2.1]|uniref:S41 family peptidase n=1 Tax=unclassified Undibacterium TaxID=2630295 RepID=UPI002B2381E9|nr:MULTISPECIES: S41 family peptidase [unclassified Undibacterium]MEB0029574.1 S41 family peptidase [Undibacterium sp. RTI2.1]MEB0115761.1 S41 family peptidase [Undibacterium sp. RTI2.2]
MNPKIIYSTVIAAMFFYFDLTSIACAETPLNHLVQADIELGKAKTAFELLRKQADSLISTNDATKIQQLAQELAEAEVVLSGKSLSKIDGDYSRLGGLLYDIRSDLARAYMRLGNTERALLVLESMSGQVIGPFLRPLIEKDEIYKPVITDSRFQKFLATQDIPKSIGSNSPIGSGFQTTLSVEQRIAGLSLFWANARRDFVYINRLPELSWDKIYMEFLPQVIAAESTKDYYQVMMRLAPLLNDSHTNIYPPDELSEVFFSRPPMMTSKIGDQVIILEIRSNTLRHHLSVGEEILKVNGQEVHQYVASRVAPYVSSSTPQDRAVREYYYQFLAGDADTPVKFTIRGIDGKIREEIVARTGYTDIEERKIFSFAVLSDNIAYLALEQFENNDGVQAFIKALPIILKSNGLILDVRRNGGGSTNEGLKILSYLTKESIPYPTSIKRSETGLDRARGDIISWTPIPLSGNFVLRHTQIYSGPVVVLAGPQTFSAAEDFLVAFDVMKRGKIIGETSAGSTGQPYFFKLPGGGNARICVKRDTYPDSKQFVGVGIKPNIEIIPTVNDIRSGRDIVLDTAVLQLKSYSEQTANKVEASDSAGFHFFSKKSTSSAIN